MKKIMGAAAIAAVFALAGCAGDPAPPAAPSVEPAKGTSSAEPSPSSDENKSPRGNLIKELGEGASLTGEDGVDLVRLSVNSIEIDPGCTQEFATAPENGHFIVLDIAVETTPEMADDPFTVGSYYLGPGDMKVIAPNGTTSNANLGTAAAFMCLIDAELLPQSFGPAEKAIGKVVIDSEVPSGTLIIGAYGMDAWEYNF